MPTRIFWRHCRYSTAIESRRDDVKEVLLCQRQGSARCRWQSIRRIIDARSRACAYVCHDDNKPCYAGGTMMQAGVAIQVMKPRRESGATFVRPSISMEAQDWRSLFTPLGGSMPGDLRQPCFRLNRRASRIFSVNTPRHSARGGQQVASAINASRMMRMAASSGLSLRWAKAVVRMRGGRKGRVMTPPAIAAP
jgi:hypothetical protein